LTNTTKKPNGTTKQKRSSKNARSQLVKSLKKEQSTSAMTDPPPQTQQGSVHTPTPLQQRFLFGEISPKWSRKNKIKLANF
jgi:hypothetical protein